MPRQFSALNQHFRTEKLRNSQFVLAILAAMLITAVACGTDRAGSGDGVAATSFQVEGDTLTWAPPWDVGDTRIVHATSSIEFNETTRQFLDRNENQGRISHDGPIEESATTGTVSIVKTGSNGSTGKFDIAFEELINRIESQSPEQQAFGDDGIEQFALLLGLTDQLDLGLEFGIDNDGAVTGVTNLDDLAETVSEFANSFLRLAAFASSEEEEFLPAEQIEMIQTLLEELPETEAAKLAIDSALNAATANLFLMRTGEYTVGEPVEIFGRTPTVIGLATDGKFSYELTELSGGRATVEVLVMPGDADLFELMQQSADELGGILGDGFAVYADDMRSATDRERGQFDAIAGLAFNPYTVTLTLDANTGWVMAADWSIELAFPDGFEEFIDADDQDFDGFELKDLGATMNFSATFE